MKAVVAAFNQEKALVGAFSVIVQPVVEPTYRFAALIMIHQLQERRQERALSNRGANLEMWIRTVTSGGGSNPAPAPSCLMESEH